MSPAAAPVFDLARLDADGYLVVPDFVSGVALDKARAAARGLPRWDPAETAEESRLSAETLRIGQATVSGTPLSRRCFMMGLGPRRPDDRANPLWGRRARTDAAIEDAADLFAPLTASLGGGTRVLRAEAEAVYPGHEGACEGRAAAEAPLFTGLRAMIFLDDVATGDGALLVWQASHRGPAPAGIGPGIFRERLKRAPKELTGAAGTLVILHPSLLRAETRRSSDGAARRFAVLLGAQELPPPRVETSAASTPTYARRFIQWAKLSVLFPLSRRLRAPLRMVNVGAGKQWQHPYVIALDVDPETDLNQDVTTTGLPFGDGTMDAVYSSHCVEHLLPADFAAFLVEARRCLRPGGVLRIVCPDMDMLFDAYERGDQDWFDWCAASFFTWDGWLRAIGRVAATLVVDRFTDEDLARLLREGGRRGFLDALTAAQADLTPKDVAPWPDAHKSWWTRPKLEAALTAAGFRDVMHVARNESRVPTFRDARFFDYSSPTSSLYVECLR